MNTMNFLEMDLDSFLNVYSALRPDGVGYDNDGAEAVQDENVVKQDEFDGMIADFQNKFRKLKKIRENKYDFSIIFTIMIY